MTVIEVTISAHDQIAVCKKCARRLIVLRKQLKGLPVPKASSPCFAILGIAATVPALLDIAELEAAMNGLPELAELSDRVHAWHFTLKYLIGKLIDCGEVRSCLCSILKVYIDEATHTANYWLLPIAKMFELAGHAAEYDRMLRLSGLLPPTTSSRVLTSHFSMEKIYDE